MFLPGNNQQKEIEERQRAYKRIEEWCLQQITEKCREDVTISVQEVQCGDPDCSPVDTAIAMIFDSDGQGMFGIPMKASDVTEEEIKHFFPTPNVIDAWHRGEDADWPPQPGNPNAMPDNLPKLRFEIGNNVLCRVGPQDWASGKIIQLWYREPEWPPGSWAPYKIKLDDGNEIFAPGDMDQIIKLNPNAK